MRRRIVINLATGVSILLFVLTISLWTLANVHCYRLTFWPPGRIITFEIWCGELRVYSFHAPYPSSGQWRPASLIVEPLDRSIANWNPGPLHVQDNFPAPRARVYPNYFQFFIPFYFLALATAGLPLVRVWRRLRAGKRRQPNQCANCGYDLRATPDKCPECGTPALSPPSKPHPIF